MHDWFRAREMVVVFVSCCSILCSEMAAFGIATAMTHQKRNLWLNEEDAQRFSGDVADIEFTSARVIHPIFYLTRMGRLRTATFTIGVGVLLILAAGAIWNAVDRY